MASTSTSSTKLKKENWSSQETLFFIKVWRQKSNPRKLQNNKKNPNISTDLAARLAKKGYTRTAQQCRTKIKYLKDAYRKANKANPPQKCRYYDQLHAILREDQISIPRQTVRSTPQTPGGRVENSLALAWEQQDARNNQAANSSFQGSTDPGEGPSAGPAGSLRPTPLAPAAVQHPQSPREKRAREVILEEKIVRIKKFLERLVERQERLAERQEKLAEWQERVVERREETAEQPERVAKQRDWTAKRQERVMQQQEGITERLERLLERQECLVGRLERALEQRRRMAHGQCRTTLEDIARIKLRFG
ncbi:uncharacterized protein LOC106731673 isoform X1 [Pelodiscus sinensis]|uniref:uncharacterized protein LOC106731673 isoform X1 n=1 Tax=Pelodiscus sinensis TaxID=13735 RepID=UPI003F6BDE82